MESKRIEIASRILNENFESAYVGLYSYYPKMRPILLDIISQLIAAEELTLIDFNSASQEVVLEFEEKRDGYTSSMLGNSLRSISNRSRSKFQKKLFDILNPVREMLISIVSNPDFDLLAIRHMPKDMSERLPQ